MPPSTLRDLVTPLNKRNKIMCVCVCEGSGGLVYCKEGGGGAPVDYFAGGRLGFALRHWFLAVTSLTVHCVVNRQLVAKNICENN